MKTPTLEWLPAITGGIVLNLGCGLRPMKGAINHDRTKHHERIDVTHDLDVMPWFPLHDLPTFDTVVAYDVVEHVKDCLGFVNEIADIIHPGGLLIMRGAAWDNPSSYIDTTHRHFLHEESFDFFDRSTRLGGHYGTFYVDSLGRKLTEWKMISVNRVNPDPRYGIGDLEYHLKKR